MRKFPVILIIIICILSFASSVSYQANAEDIEVSISYDTIYGNPAHYFKFNSPTNLTYNGSSYAVFDNNVIYVFADDVYTIEYEHSIKEMLLIDEYLLILSDEFAIYIINYKNGDIIDNSSILNASPYPTSMTYDYSNGLLYVFGITNIRSFAVNLSSGIDISYNEEVIDIIGAPSIASSNSLYYTSNQLLLYKISARQLYSIDLSSKTLTTVITNASSNVKYITANNQYIFLVEDDKVTRYLLNGSYIDDIFTTGASKDDSLSDIGGVSISGNTMYISNPSYSAVKVFTITSTGKLYNYMYGTKGTGLRRLNKPNNLTSRGNTLYISDTMNDRVIKYNLDINNNITGTPLSIGSSGNTEGLFIMPDSIAMDYTSGLYIGDSTGRLQYFLRDVFVRDYSFNSITDIVISSNDTVFVSDSVDNKVYYKTKDNSEFNTLLSLDTAPLNLAVSMSGNIIYIATNDGILAYSLKGDLMPFNIIYDDYDIDSIVAFNVDYNGNIFILTNGLSPKIYRFSRSINSYTLSQIMLFDDLEQPLLNPLGMSLNDDGRLFIANSDHHSLIVVSSDVTNASTEITSTYEHPTTIVNPTRIAYVKNFATIYYNPSNYEDITSINEGECVPVLNESTYDGIHYYYIEYEGKKAYIRQIDTILMNAGAAPMEYVKPLHPTLDIYLYPSPNSPKIFNAIERNTLIQVISNVAERDSIQMWNWYEVRYSNTTGYVLKTEVIPATMPVVEVVTHNAKIRSPILGERVNMYSLPDSHSAIIDTIADGTKVELDAPIDYNSEYTLIKYNDVTGYVRSEHLIDSGLTTGQILAIVLAVITFSATGTVLFISRIIKRSSN